MDLVFDEFVRSFAATKKELVVLASMDEISSLKEAKQYLKNLGATP